MRTTTTLLLVAILALPAQGQQASYDDRDAAARRAAAEALPVLRQLVTRGNAQAMGFRSADEAARATLQEPLRIFLVRLDPLRKFHAGQDPQELLTGGDRVLFPLAVDGEVRSSVEVDGSGGHWRTAGFGRPALVRALAAARDKIGASPGSPAFAVHVAALNLYFVGKRDGGQLLLAAVIADPRLKLALGETRPAQEVFAELVPLAQKYNGLPE